MLERNFMTGPVDKAALASLAAMVAFNVFALSQQLSAQPTPLVASVQAVELA